jgi:hypothetical protein
MQRADVVKEIRRRNQLGDLDVRSRFVEETLQEPSARDLHTVAIALR